MICRCSCWARPTSRPSCPKTMHRVLVVPWSIAATKSAMQPTLDSRCRSGADDFRGPRRSTRLTAPSDGRTITSMITELTTSGYADVNGLHLYYEVYGA